MTVTGVGAGGRGVIQVVVDGVVVSAHSWGEGYHQATNALEQRRVV